MSLAPSRAADSAIAHAMLCLFATPRIRPFLPSSSIDSFLLADFFATTQEGAKNITEQTEKTERTEPSQETFRPFRFFRLFRNPLRHFQSRYEFYFHERSEDNTARRI